MSCKDSCIVQTYDNLNRLFEDGRTVIVRAVNLDIFTRFTILNYTIIRNEIITIIQ